MRYGSDHEDRAAAYLLSLGWTVVTRRFCAKHGELDIVALDGDELVFVEVKYRKSGFPEQAISLAKVERLQKAAREYLAYIEEPERSFRFDVIAIDAQDLRHHRHVFQDWVVLD